MEVYVIWRCIKYKFKFLLVFNKILIKKKGGGRNCIMGNFYYIIGFFFRGKG